MRKSILLPGLFALLVVPLAWFVRSGAGTHMSPLLLYLPAAPWWLFFSADSTEEEIRSLILGCMINFVILAVAGMAWDGAAMRRKQGPEP
jgi:hypothetical protein